MDICGGPLVGGSNCKVRRGQWSGSGIRVGMGEDERIIKIIIRGWTPMEGGGK